MPNPVFYTDIAKLWPIYSLFYLSLQWILPRLIRHCASDENQSKWQWLHGKTRSGSKAADYVSYLLISGSIVIFCSLLALCKWSELQALPLDSRLYENIPEAQLLASVMLAYQIYNFAVCFVLPEECGKIEHKLHHATTGLLAYFVLYPYAHYYAVFFVGIAEITNVPLTVVDACRAFPELRSMIPTVNTWFRTIFAVTFFLIRGLWWPYVSYQFWLQSIELLRTGTAHRNSVVFIFLISNVGLTLLQFYWGYSLFGFVLATFKTRKKKDGGEDQERSKKDM